MDNADELPCIGEMLTIEDVSKYLKVNKKTIYRMINLRQIPAFKVSNQWRFKKCELDKWIDESNVVTEIPILGTVAAGKPMFAEENYEGMLTVDKSIVGKSKDIFALKVKGSSMIDGNIEDGDYIVIQKQPQVFQGERAVVIVNGEATVKKYYEEQNMIRLQPQNETMQPIIVDPSTNEVSIAGKVKAVIKRNKKVVRD